MDAQKYVEDTDTFLLKRDASNSDLWRYLAFDTPENTWQDFEKSLIARGWKLKFVWEINQICLTGIEFDTRQEKLKFLIKFTK